jgi:hypothetical protein
VTPASLFAVVWETLVDILGSASAATLIRRAVSRAASRAPELKEVKVLREGLEYRCVVPATWNDTSSIDTLRELCVELQAILFDLTGVVVLSRLRTVPAIAESGLFAHEREGVI